MQLKEVYVELHNKCLLNCRHCSSKASNMGNECLTPEKVNDILFEARSMGAECFSISGGEPFLYRWLWDVLDTARELGYKTRLYTCGITENFNEVTSIEEEDFSRVINYGVERIIFSLQGAKPPTHDYITDMNGSFGLVIESIRRAIRLGLPTEIHTVPMSVNYREIPEIVRLSEELGVQNVSLLRLVPHGRCRENKHLLMSNEQTKEFISIIESIDSRFVSIRKGAPYRCLFHNASSVCSAGKDKILIGYNGRVYPCEAFKSFSKASNINDSSIRNIWKNDGMLNTLREQKIRKISVCNDCSERSICRGGCPGQRWLEHGDIFTGPDPICIM